MFLYDFSNFLEALKDDLDESRYLFCPFVKGVPHGVVVDMWD